MEYATGVVPAPSSQKKGWVRKVLGVSFLLFLCFLFISILGLWMGFGEKELYQSGFFQFHAKKSVGVLEIKGVILSSKKTLEKIQKFEENPSVRALLVRIDSPGGAVAPSQEIYQALRQFPKPVVASLGSVAASGGYYIACGAKKIFANPGTLTGSIGVIMEFINLQKLYRWAKVHRYVIKTGKFKDIGSEYRDMTSEEKALLNTMLQDVLAQFREAVQKARNMTRNQILAVSDGRIFSGRQAFKKKLVDRLGSFQDAVKEAARLGGIVGKPKLLYLKRSDWDFLGEIFSGSEDEQGRFAGNRVQSLFQKGMFLLERFLNVRQGAKRSIRGGVYWLWPYAR